MVVEDNITQKCPEGYKWIPSYEGLYCISEKGDIFSVRRNKILSAGKVREDFIVTLKSKQYYVHKLVGLVYNNIPYTKLVYFEDGNHSNLHYTNIKEKVSVFYELIGQTINKLTILKVIEKPNQKPRFECTCSCGKNCILIASQVKVGKTKSCGCLKGEVTAERNTIHSLSRTPTYQCWLGFKGRCYNQNDEAYHDYGGRGITVCDRWLEPEGRGFLNFLEDMGERPEGLTLDRINTNGNYEPNNCRWADRGTQARNRRKRKTNTSGTTGVYLDRGKWLVRICEKHLGWFVTKEEAIAARKNAESTLFEGEFGEYV